VVEVVHLRAEQLVPRPLSARLSSVATRPSRTRPAFSSRVSAQMTAWATSRVSGSYHQRTP
jgi:hypothetical protein